MSGAVIVLIGLVPGMPHGVFLLLGGGMGWATWWLAHRPPPLAPQPDASLAAAEAEASWDDLKPVDLLGLELGYRLIALVDKARDGDLMARIKGVRKKFAQEVGFLPPPVHIRDNLELRPNSYRVTLRGVVIGEAEAFAGMYMAINPGNTQTQLPGTATTDPAFGLPAVWIEERQRETAQIAGFTVVDSPTVMATHLSHLMQVHAAKLLSRTETQQLVDHVSKLAPQLIEDIIPKTVPISVFQRVLQLLLEESVHIRDMRTIIETLAEHGGSISDPVELVRRIRIALAPAIVQAIYGPARELNVIAIEPHLERLLVQALGTANSGGLDPGVTEMLTKAAGDASKRQEDLGIPACLLVPDTIRGALARLLRRAAPRMQVLGHSEIPDTHLIRIGPLLGGASA